MDPRWTPSPVQRHDASACLIVLAEDGATPEAEILAAESDRLDLLVIRSRGYGALRARLGGSVAHELAGTSHARCCSCRAE